MQKKSKTLTNCRCCFLFGHANFFAHSENRKRKSARKTQLENHRTATCGPNCGAPKGAEFVAKGA